MVTYQLLFHVTGLAQTYGNDASFTDYLQYLEYWRQPQYAKYIMCDTLNCQNSPNNYSFRVAHAASSAASEVLTCDLGLFTCSYPHAFHFLNLLQRNEFRTAVASASVRVRLQLVMKQLRRRGMHILDLPTVPSAGSDREPAILHVAALQTEQRTFIPGCSSCSKWRVKYSLKRLNACS